MSDWLRLRSRLDRILAAVMGVVLAPILGLLALLIRSSDAGPGFVRIPRIGGGGRTFAMWKLRTMRTIDSTGLASGGRLTFGADERITSVGRRLRRHRLDELPQLLNVVRGEMTLLGPRPESPEYVRQDDQRWVAVLSAPPGIAGPTQLLVERLESELTAETADRYVDSILPLKLAIDRWYVENASPRLDLLILIALMGHVGGRPLLPALLRRVVADVPEVQLLLALDPIALRS